MKPVLLAIAFMLTGSAAAQGYPKLDGGAAYEKYEKVVKQSGARVN